MKLYLVCVSSYDSCYHICIYDSYESAKKACVDWIDEELYKLEKWKEESFADVEGTEDDINALLKCKELGKFESGGGVYDFPSIEEFELNEIKRWI